MASFMVRRISDQENFGIIKVEYHSDLFDKVDSFTDPYGFEYSSSSFNLNTGNFGHPIMWKRFEYPSRTLSNVL